MRLKDKLLSTHHTAICVNDFERARDFYTDFLGFEVEGEMDHRCEPALGEVVGLPGAVIRWAMLRNGTHRVELFKYYTPEGDPRARRQCDFGYSHMAFEVADVDSVYEQAMRAGYRSVSSPRALRNGRTRVFYLAEPEGAITEFIQFVNPGASKD
ncbi:MAG: VOC family protein [Burkholderiaceae bacterium]|nr:VOC family protein [Burkholderiaceae bacterium]